MLLLVWISVDVLTVFRCVFQVMFLPKIYSACFSVVTYSLQVSFVGWPYCLFFQNCSSYICWHSILFDSHDTLQHVDSMLWNVVIICLWMIKTLFTVNLGACLSLLSNKIVSDVRLVKCLTVTFINFHIYYCILQKVTLFTISLISAFLLNYNFCAESAIKPQSIICCLHRGRALDPNCDFHCGWSQLLRLMESKPKKK